MTTLYLKIDERNGIVSPNFRAYLEEGTGGAVESFIALQIAYGMLKNLTSLAKDGLAPVSFKTEAEKITQELGDLYELPKSMNDIRINLAERLIKALEEAN